jgi:MarR family transcriptional regulator for hemolysin
MSTDPALDVGALLERAARGWVRALERWLAQGGVGDVAAPARSVLVALVELDGVRMSDLARRLSLSNSSVTAAARGLAERGLVERREDPADGRAARLFLTEAGRERADAIAARIDEFEARVLERLPAEAASFRAALRTLAGVPASRPKP